MKISGWTFIAVKYGKEVWHSGKLLDTKKECKAYYEDYRETFEPLVKDAEIIYVKLTGKVK